MALDESERRVAIYDQRMLYLERCQKRGRIAADVYQWQSEQIMLCIRQESLFENALLLKRSDLSLRARDVLETVEHVSIAVPTYTLLAIAYILGHCSGLSGSFSP